MKVYYKGCKIIVAPGSVVITKGGNEYIANLEFTDIKVAVDWAKHKIDEGVMNDE